MRAVPPGPIRASLVLGLALVLALAQASGGAAWSGCERGAPKDDGERCCCDGKATSSCCDSGAATPRDRLVNGCGCGHMRVPGATLPSREPTLGPTVTVQLPEPVAAVRSTLVPAAPRTSLRDAPEQPPPRARA
jgi:hypothetical protein